MKDIFEGGESDLFFIKITTFDEIGRTICDVFSTVFIIQVGIVANFIIKCFNTVLYQCLYLRYM